MSWIVDERPMRVTYREGQRLSADDLSEEQEYLIAQERRHNLRQHSPGVVSGLGHGTNPEQIEPGVAVNAEGRLLVVDDEAVLDGNCIDAWLIHCERPGRPRRHGSPSCEPAQTGRREEVGQVVTVGATADGPIASPTEDAVYLGRFGCSGKDLITYTSAIAASIKDPAGRALMQVGSLSSSDRNAFLISTAGSDRALMPRIALERFGNNRFIGNVTLADYHYCKLLRLTDDKVLTLVAKTPGSLGAALRLQMTPSLEGTTRKLTAQIFSGTEKLGDQLVWRESEEFDPEKDLGLLTNASILLKAVPSIQLPRIFDRASMIPDLSPSANNPALFIRSTDAQAFEPQKSSESKELFDRFAVQQSIQLHPCGGSLIIRDWHAATETKDNRFRGCDDLPPEDGEPTRDPAGLSFLPMTEVPKAPPIPGIYSVKAGDKKNPIEELHLDLGKKRDSDLSTRFALGMHGANEGDPFVPWLEVNGICGVSLPFPVASNAQKIPISVYVNGTIERGPIKADLSDPTFTNLMAMAWLAGLQKSVPESTKYEVSFALPSAVIENDELTYDINVKNPPGHAITADGFIETLNVPSGNPRIFSAPIKPAATIDANGTSLARKIIHTEQTFPAGKIESHVVVYGKDAGLYWWKSQKGTIQIAASPIVNMEGIPDPVPSGTAFDAIVVVRNEDNDLRFTVQTVTIDNLVNGTQNVDLAPQTSQSYTRNFAGISADHDIKVEVTYQWQGDIAARTISFTKTVHVHDDLDLTIQITTVPTTATPIKFDLTVKNDGPRKLTLTSIKQSLKSPGLGQQTVIPIGTALIASQDETTIAGIIGDQLTSPSNDVKLVIDVEYKRDGRAWHPPPKEKVV